MTELAGNPYIGPPTRALVPPPGTPVTNRGYFSGNLDENSRNIDQLKGQCTFDSSCWNVKMNCVISNGVMFDRMTGSTCEECLEECLNHQSRRSPYICRSVTYDHRWKICDLFAIDGQQGSHFLSYYPGRDYFMMTTPGVVNGCRRHQRVDFLEEEFVTSRPTSIDARQQLFKESQAIFLKGSETIQGQPTTTQAPSFLDKCSKSANEVARFCKYLKSDLQQEPVISVIVLNEPECLEKCQNNEGLVCSSIVFDRRDSRCELFAIDRNSGAQVLPRDGWEGSKSYYEKVCLPKDLVQGTDLIWEIHRNFILLGHVQEVTDASSLKDCKLNCLNAEDHFGFMCKSVMFYQEDLWQNCLLNSETKTSKPEDFLQDESTTGVYYFEIGRNPFHRKFHDSVLDVDRLTGHKWTLWTDCEMSKNGISYRYQKCPKMDIRSCKTARKVCKKDKKTNATIIKATVVSRSPCISIKDRNGIKRCPHGYMIRNGRKKYCNRPVDC